EQVDAQAAVGHDPHHDRDGDQHPGEARAFDADVRDGHGATLSGRAGAGDWGAEGDGRPGFSASAQTTDDQYRGASNPRSRSRTDSRARVALLRARYAALAGETGAGQGSRNDTTFSPWQNRSSDSEVGVNEISCVMSA